MMGLGVVGRYYEICYLLAREVSGHFGVGRGERAREGGADLGERCDSDRR